MQRFAKALVKLAMAEPTPEERQLMFALGFIVAIAEVKKLAATNQMPESKE